MQQASAPVFVQARRHLPFAATEVGACWTRQELLQDWLRVAALPFEPSPSSTKLAFRWPLAGFRTRQSPPSVTRVEVELRPVTGGTELVLTHSGFRSETTGSSLLAYWSDALESLERTLRTRAPLLEPQHYRRAI
jgi:hypothetical protein